MIEQADLYEAWVIGCKQHYERCYKKNLVETFNQVPEDKLPEAAQKCFRKKLDASLAFAKKASESFKAEVTARVMSVHAEPAFLVTMDVGGGLLDVEMFDEQGKLIAHATIEAHRIHWKKIGYGAT